MSLIWEFIKQHQLLDLAGFLVIVFVGLKFNSRRVKRIDKNGFEFFDEKDEKINPNTPCPYAESKKRSVERIEANAKQIAENTKSIEALSVILTEIVAKVDDFRLDQLKVIFWTESLPVEERLIAGLKYVAAGGNHDTKTETIRLAKENLNLYKTIIALKPELKLAEIV